MAGHKPGPPPHPWGMPLRWNALRKPFTTRSGWVRGTVPHTRQAETEGKPLMYIYLYTWHASLCTNGTQGLRDLEDWGIGSGTIYVSNTAFDTRLLILSYLRYLPPKS